MTLKFTYICDLLDRLESLEVRDTPLLPFEKAKQYRAIIDSWFKSHRKLIDAPNTDRVALLSTLFPERRTDRVYFLKEPGLIRILGRCLGLGRDRLRILQTWTPSSSRDLATLISELLRITDAGMPSRHVTVEEIDTALARVASRCRFSGPAVRAGESANLKYSLPDDTLRPIVVALSSRDLKWFVRLVLKRFSPVTLEEHLVLRHVHFLLPKLLQFQSTFDAAVRILHNPLVASIPPRTEPQLRNELVRKIASQCLRPQIGIKIGRSDFVKARSIKHCLKITGKGRWAIEPKYDGEYCQLHVDLSKEKNCIQIFSKSGKDSTKDRSSLHNWITSCLRIGQPDCKFQHKCILLGEVVVYSEKEHSILEFHKIRKHVSRSGSFIGTEADSQRHAHEHLMIVFFDALLIDEDIVMAQPYEIRRRRLRELIHYYQGWCQTADWGTIDFGRISGNRAVRKLDKAFAKAIALRCEGLVLKPCDKPYFSLEESSIHHKVIKLKKDYIPGLGDTADFAIVGASYVAAEQPTEARGIKWTHYTVACLQNKSEVCRFHERPIFKVMGVLSRPCIPIADLRHMSDYGQFMVESCNNTTGPTRYDLLQDEYETPMDVCFKKPFLVEVLGSSFGKPSSKSYYMLRHPRILKIHHDRGYEDVVSFDELQEMARRATTIPEDIAREEAEWLERLQHTHKRKESQETCSNSTNSKTTLESPESKKTSPAKSPSNHQQVPLVRIDTAELLPEEHEHNPSITAKLQSARLSRHCTHAFPTPPTSFVPFTPTAKHLITPPKFQMTPMCRKRKRENSDLTVQFARAPLKLSGSATPNDNRRFDPQLDGAIGKQRSDSDFVAKKKPLTEITNSPPKPYIAYETEQWPMQLQDENSSTPGNSTNGERAMCRDLERRISMIAASDSPSTAQTESPTILRAPASAPLTCSVTQARVQEHLPVTGLPLQYFSSTAVGQELPQLLQEQCPSSNELRGSTLSPSKSTPSIQPPPPCLVQQPHHPTTLPSLHMCPISVHVSHVPPIAAAANPPFSNHTFHLSPCVASIPFLTQDLLPSLLSSFPPHANSHPSSTSAPVHITSCLSHWTRDLQHLTASAALVSESQAYPGMRKAVLVESRRIPQTAAIVQRVVEEIRLAADELVEVWDWRVVEGYMESLKEAGVSGDGDGGAGEDSVIVRLAMEEQMNGSGMEVVQLRRVLRKWYVGCIRWSEEQGGNVWVAATAAMKQEKAEEVIGGLV